MKKTHDIDNIRKKSDTELAAEKSKRIMNGVAAWCSFYRENPQRFVKDYLNINLKWFQKILIYQMVHNDNTLYIASRGQGKSYITALFCCVMCILYPKIQICVTAPTRPQANNVLLKITNDFMKSHEWGSENLRREIIGKPNIGINKAEIEFKNGSLIQVVTAADSARSFRANILVVDEYVKVDPTVITDVLKPFLTTPRQPEYLNNPKYAHLSEDNKELYMSSAFYQSHWSFKQFQTFFANMFDETKKYFVCDLPYQLPIREGLLKRNKIKNDMSEATYDEVKFQMEYCGIWFGDTDGSFFTYDDISKRRKLQTAIYPNFNSNNKNDKVPDLAMNERRILSVDVALMASKKQNNDASSIIINSAIPTNNNNYIANVVYLENHEGLTTDDLALVVRRLYHYYKCTDLVVDAGGQGIGLFDALIKDIFDPETGMVYPALSCCNDKIMAERCKVDNAPKVIWSIKASASFNSEICTLLRSGFKQGKINLLVDDDEAEGILADKIKNYSKMPAGEKLSYTAPYLQTTFLVYELINLQYEIKGTNIRIIEKSGMRKDRYSSLAYNYWVMCQLEREVLRKQKTGFNASEYASKLRRLNHKPTMY